MKRWSQHEKVPEVVERAVRMVLKAQEQYQSQWMAIESIADMMGCTAETLQRWVRQAESLDDSRPEVIA